MLRLSPDPPTVVDAPWNSMCVQLGGTADTSVSGVELSKVIIAQAGFTGVTGLTIDMRVFKIRCYCLANKRPMRILVFGLDNTRLSAGGAIANIVDYPSQNHYAAVGYEFSAALSQIVLSSDSTDKVFSVEIGNPYAWLAYVDVLWRGNSITPIASTVRSRLTEYQRRLDAMEGAFSNLSISSTSVSRETEV